MNTTTITISHDLTPSGLRALASSIVRGIAIDDPGYLAARALAEALEDEAEQVESLATFEQEWAATHPLVETAVPCF